MECGSENSLLPHKYWSLRKRDSVLGMDPVSEVLEKALEATREREGGNLATGQQVEFNDRGRN